MSEPPVYFLSDAHLGAEDASAESRKVERLEAFLAFVRSRPGPLYLDGDLFDFWFEYRRAVPRGHFRILTALMQTRLAGCPITYVGGNHDFWVGDFLAGEMGIRVEQEPVDLRIQGRRLFLAHGDGVLARDGSYRLMKSVLRSPLNISLYRLLHPDFGIPLALWVSRLSAGRHHVEKPIPLDEIRSEVVTPRMREGFDAVVLGHFHKPVHMQGDGKDFLVLGDWMRHFTFASLEDGKFRLWKWNEGSPEVIAPEPAVLAPSAAAPAGAQSPL